MQLSVVIVNYNVKYFLEQALHSIRKASHGLQVEVFVVDNHSVDGSCEMVKRKFPEVILIENKDNVGFSVANNQAIRQSSGEYILLLNPDTVVQEDTFHKVIDFMHITPDAGAVGVKMIDGKGRFLPESKRSLPTPAVAFYKMFGFAALFPKSKRFGRYHLGFLDNNETHAVDVLAGAFMMLRKSVLGEIGILDEDYFMYGEDIDLSFRITQGGYKNYYFPHTTIIHYKGESTKRTSVNYVFVFYRAMIVFAQKHYSTKHAKLFSALISAAIYVRAGAAIVSRVVKTTFLWFIDMLLFILSVRLIADYYARFKFDSVDAYADYVVNFNSIIYALLWTTGLYLAGSYARRFSVYNIAKGILFGSLAIAVFYAFADSEYRFSRAIILLGSLAATLFAYSVRLGLYVSRNRRLDLSLNSAYNTIIVGNEEEVSRVQHLLVNSKAKCAYLGYVSVAEGKPHNEEYLGTHQQLEEIVALFDIDEIIFCSKDLSTEQIMKWMYTMNKPDVHFKIVPEESVFIIGSNSKDEPGDFYTLEVNLALNKPIQLRKKRAFDIAASLFILFISPLLVLLVRNKLQFFPNIIKVLWGEKTWVGYASGANEHLLPKIKPCVVTTMPKSQTVNLTTIQKLNFLYAKEYSIEKDLTILLKSLVG
jgi:GT2 family glycosyltransferase